MRQMKFAFHDGHNDTALAAYFAIVLQWCLKWEQHVQKSNSFLGNWVFNIRLVSVTRSASRSLGIQPEGGSVYG